MRSLIFSFICGFLLASGLAWASHDLLDQMQQRQERFNQEVERQQQQMFRNQENLDRMLRPYNPC